jgi:short-subunit dehydrogenase
LDIPLNDHARLVDVNLKSVIYGTYEAIIHFREQGQGTIINIGSVDSEVPLAYQSTYAATKAAVLSLGRSINEELRLAGQNEKIQIGTIMPWAVDTPWWTHAANYTGHAPRMAAMDDPEIVVEAIVSACLKPQEKQPVGVKAHVANMSHQIFPDLTEHLSANVANKEVAKGTAVPDSSGAIYDAIAEGTTVEGGLRKRMKKEDEKKSSNT